jgi:hypothetical protein
MDQQSVAAEEWRQTFSVIVYIAPLENDPIPVDQYNNAIAAALHAAVMADYTRGGLAYDTQVLPTLYYPPVDEEFGGINFNFEVQYRHVLDDPYTGAI